MNSADRNQLRGGRNLSVSVGADLELYAVRHYFLEVEARGTYPLKSGKIVGERSVLAGLRLSRGVGENGRVRPYVDVLFGRGQMDYQRGGYVVPGFLYTRSSSNVFDGGAGVEFDVTDRFAFKVDGQVQHWSTPVLTSGSAYSKQVSVGVAYRIGAGGGPR
jgi:opacity protein-like surface antigen